MEKDYKCSIALIPPLHVWASIQNIRSQHDEQYLRWPPHINVVYPFIRDIPAVLQSRGVELCNALRSVSPFVLNFNKFGYFAHRHANTIWMAPEASPATALHDVYAALLSVYTECKDNKEFAPHLSVAQAGAGAVVPMIRELQSNWSAVQCEVCSAASS